MNVLTGNYLNYFFRSRRTNRPIHTPYDMYSNLWGGKSSFAGQYVYSHILHQNALSPASVLPPSLFSPMMHSGAETTHSEYTHTPCNAIVHFCIRPFRDHFTPCARKRGPKIGVAHLVIFCYLLSITAFCAPTALHLISILPYTQYTVEKIRLFSYFSNPVALLKSGRAASLSRPILAL